MPNPRIPAAQQKRATIDRRTWTLVGLVAGVLVLGLLLVSHRYGYHRDELYFVAAGRRLAWGFVDQPPLTPAIARLVDLLPGDLSPTALRVVPALSAGTCVVLTAVLARRFGAGSRAIVVAAVFAAVGGFFVAVGHLLSTTTFDVLIWLAIVTVVAALIDGGDPRWWLAVGALVGLGMLNKFTVVGVVVGLGVGLIATPQRRILKSTWLPAGAALALVIAAPTLIWQANHNWPQLEMSGAISGRDGPADYVLIQIAVLSFFLIIPAAAGWKWLMFDDLGRRWRSLAIAFVFLFIAFLASGGKGYYVAPLYLPLFAAGAIWFAGLRRSLIRAVGAVVAVGAVAGLFVALPLLPPERAELVNEINKELGETYGWAQFVDQIEAVYLALPPLERDNAVIYTSNYGEAGAIELLGAGRLPQPVSGHNNYWLWGPGTRTGPIIGIGAVPDAIRSICTALTLETKITNSAGIENEEFGRDVWKCDTSTPLSSIWDDLRHYG